VGSAVSWKFRLLAWFARRGAPETRRSGELPTLCSEVRCHSQASQRTGFSLITAATAALTRFQASRRRDWQRVNHLSLLPFRRRFGLQLREVEFGHIGRVFALRRGRVRGLHFTHILFDQ
jgi:hypothetical protein